MTELAIRLPRVKNYHFAVKEWNDDIIFLRKLVDGGTNRSYGIQVARLAGIPAPVIERSKVILAGIENGKKISRSGSETSARQTQLGLFRHQEEELVDNLKRLDVTRMTPMDAMNWLSDLVDKAKAI